MNAVKNFQCECGKLFANPQSFNGHKSHCKIHRVIKGGEENYTKYLQRQRASASAARQASKRNAEERNSNELAIWLANKPTCEKCGKVMTEKFGSGRFCSSSCSQSRTHSAETRQKIKASLDKTLVSQCKEPSRNKKFCSVCSAEIKSYNKTGLCRNCLDHTQEGLKIKQELGKFSYALKLERGTHVGWQSRKKTSYAEKFWKKVLDNNNFKYEREFLINCYNTHYFLDFRLQKGDKVIDLEIDGKQHTYPDHIVHDSTRDKNLSALGYIVYRIPWNEINSEQGKAEMQNKINNFLDFYNSL